MAGRHPPAPAGPSGGGLDRACRERADVLGGQRVTGDAPIAALDLLDHAPGDLAHVLALDRHHRVGQTLDDLLLLIAREHAFDELDVDERHRMSLSLKWCRTSTEPRQGAARLMRGTAVLRAGSCRSGRA